MADCFWENFKNMTCHTEIPPVIYPPDNDNLDSSILTTVHYHNYNDFDPIAPTVTSWDYTNEGATLESGEPSTYPDDFTGVSVSTDKSVWFRSPDYYYNLFILCPVSANMHLATFDYDNSGDFSGLSNTESCGPLYSTIVTGQGPDGGDYRVTAYGVSAKDIFRVSSEIGSEGSLFSIWRNLNG